MQACSVETWKEIGRVKHGTDPGDTL
jgi:ferritin-like protein